MFGAHPVIEKAMEGLSSMSKFLRFVIFSTCFIAAGNALAQGACPASAPVTGNHCYFIAANGSDANSGTSESSPWLHAPGMPNCTGQCAKVTPTAGEGFIFRGGDTWHFGNSATMPYTGGNMDLAVERQPNKLRYVRRAQPGRDKLYLRRSGQDMVQR